MPDRADAHIHLFETSFRSGSFTARPGVNIDEVACYQSLMKDHGVTAALVVGWAGAPYAAGNNAFLARVVGDHKWVHPTAYVEPSDAITVASLEERRQQGFVGLSFYIFGDEKVAALKKVPDETWRWLVEHHWLVSVNSRGKDWGGWLPILDKHGKLRIVMSHLGLPGATSKPLTDAAARKALADVLGLAKYAGPRVKLSGFYATTDPHWDYPHENAWPYVEALVKDFGVKRLVWGSDFSPSLDHLTFPQTIGLFAKMPFLKKADRERIEGKNLLSLLEEARTES
ncbi:MAG: amidohydrolase family protein [Phycisphaerae bacterium]|nr:amidohydrolase family protein [Phycisphaerae bacterium]